ncbi:MAG TPA: FkbM family methyltransferase [Chryseolinea sp.]|nr:FkbM family methyltransferase [Chryseolinea sp.]
MRNLFIKVIRDNEVANWFGRRIVKGLIKVVRPLEKLTTMYRIYGTVKLKVSNVEFKIYDRADDHIANDIYYCLGYEDAEFLLLKQLIKRSRYMVDVGANTGIFSIYAASLNSGLEVLSFEPHPSNYKRLLTNVSINKLNNIKAYDCALGPSDSEIEFTIPADMSISTTSSANDGFTRNFHRLEYVKVPVRQKKLDDILANIPVTSADVFKIDVEYYELEVLKGAEATLRNKRPMIIIELLDYSSLVTQFPQMEGNVDKSHAHDIINFLTKIGYHPYAIGTDGLHAIDAKRNSRNFLFIPHKLSREDIAFEEISAVLAESPQLLASIPGTTAWL